jgi:sporulation protein YlmC with PRC-barrel domain
MKRLLAASFVGLAAIGPAVPALSAPPATGNTTTAAAPADKVLVATSFRASKLIGMNVRNAEGEKLGTINDFVLDVRTGKIAYAALSVGGVLGVGDKLFAVPYTELKFDHGKDEQFFVLNASKQKLEAAPGFDQSNWPNFADPHWSDQIDKYYREARAKEVSARPAK